MYQLFRRKTPIRFIVIFTMLVSLLLAQGLRVCLHDAVSGGSFHGSTATTHLESDFVADHEDGASTSAKEVALVVVLKQFGVEIKLIAVVFALLAFVPPARITGRVSIRPVTALSCFCFRARRPPLRAPPL